MKKQLIIKIPSDMPIDKVTKYINDQFDYGYPLVLLDDWKYEVVEIDKTMMVIHDDNNSRYEKMDNAMNIMKANEIKKKVLSCLDYCENNGFGKNKTIDRIRKTINGECSE